MAEQIDPHTSILDANIVLRFIIKDVPVQTALVTKLFADAEVDSLVLVDVIILECVYVMEKLYHYERTTIARSLRFVIDHPAVRANSLAWNMALGLYREAPISIADSYLCVLSQVDQQRLISFDQRLGRYATVDDLT